MKLHFSPNVFARSQLSSIAVHAAFAEELLRGRRMPEAVASARKAVNYERLIWSLGNAADCAKAQAARPATLEPRYGATIAFQRYPIWKSVCPALDCHLRAAVKRVRRISRTAGWRINISRAQRLTFGNRDMLQRSFAVRWPDRSGPIIVC